MPPSFPRGLQPGDELDYVEKTSSLTVTATTEGTAQSFIDGNEIIVDGNTRLRIEFECGYVQASGGTLVPVLVEDSTVIGWLGELVGTAWSFNRSRFRTPSAGRHTYHVKVWKTGGTCALFVGAGGSGTDLPAFMRITRA